MSELLPLVGDRPPIYRDRDGTITYISIHDKAYLDSKRQWKRKVAALHPDKTGNGRSARQFRAVYNAYQKWLALERVWYWHHGEMMPPDWKGKKEKPPYEWTHTTVRNGKRIKCKLSAELLRSL